MWHRGKMNVNCLDTYFPRDRSLQWLINIASFKKMSSFGSRGGTVWACHLPVSSVSPHSGDKPLKWKITLLARRKWEPLTWFWDNAHWLINNAPWDFDIEGVCLSSRLKAKKGASDICHQYTTVAAANILIYLFPKGAKIWDLSCVWKEDRRYCSLWAWLKPLYESQTIMENAFLVSLTEDHYISCRADGFQVICSFFSSRCKSIGNLSSSTIATVIALIAELGRINAVSSLSVVRAHTVWKYVAAQLQFEMIVIYFVYFESQTVPLAAPKAEADWVD